MESLDNILSRGGEAVPAQEIENNQTETVMQAATDGESQPEHQAEAETAETEEGRRTAQVPHQALHAEKQKVKRYTEEVASLRQEIADRDAAWERRIAQLVQAQQPKPEPQAKPDFFENPEAATRATAQELVDPRFNQITQTMQAMAQMIAGQKFGDDKVAEAEKAFGQAYQSGKIDQADAEKVLRSPNMYAAAVQWHQRQLAQAEIGDDPAAYKAKLEADLREKITAELQQEGQQAQQRQPGQMPSNLAGARNMGARSGPAWSGPTPMTDIFKH